MALWDWALEAYGRPGVAEVCLRLQDAFGQNVSLLLWAFAMRPADPGLLARAVEVARRWDDVALLSLRGARRALKPACPPIPDEARQRLRDELKAAELHAERVLIDTLEELSGGAPVGASGLAALKAASRAWGGAAPEPALALLAAALE